jgi:hypothetical protein
MTTLLPGLVQVFPFMQWGVGKGIPGTLQEGMAAPVDVTASMPAI